MNLKAVWVGGQDWIKNKQQQQNIGAGDKAWWVWVLALLVWGAEFEYTAPTQKAVHGFGGLESQLGGNDKEMLRIHWTASPA